MVLTRSSGQAHSAEVEGLSSDGGNGSWGSSQALAIEDLDGDTEGISRLTHTFRNHSFILNSDIYLRYVSYEFR